mmetsp:Transcript_37001/g.96899  ORF Transcript_37001/g.96899 Transcript_37001/m.96899 type:complete len:765 (-) Transcript_37001:169-2463(-)
MKRNRHQRHAPHQRRPQQGQAQRQPPGRGVGQVVGLHLLRKFADDGVEEPVLLAGGADGGDAVDSLSEVAEDRGPGGGVQAPEVAGAGEVPLGDRAVEEEQRDHGHHNKRRHNQGHHNNRARPPHPVQVRPQSLRQVPIQNTHVLRQPVHHPPLGRHVIPPHRRPQQGVLAVPVQRPGRPLAHEHPGDHVAHHRRHGGQAAQGVDPDAPEVQPGVVRPEGQPHVREVPRALPQGGGDEEQAGGPEAAAGLGVHEVHAAADGPGFALVLLLVLDGDGLGGRRGGGALRGGRVLRGGAFLGGRALLRGGAGDPAGGLVGAGGVPGLVLVGGVLEEVGQVRDDVLVQHLLVGAVEKDALVLNGHDTIGLGQDLPRVGHQHNGLPLEQRPPEALLEHVCGHVRIQRTHHIIEEDHVRVVVDRAAQGHALLLAPGEVDPSVADLSLVPLREHVQVGLEGAGFQDLVVAPGIQRLPILRLRPHQDIPPQRRVTNKSILRAVPHGPPYRHATHVRREGQLPQQGLQEPGLPGPGAADDDDELPLLHGEGHAPGPLVGLEEDAAVDPADLRGIQRHRGLRRQRRRLNSHEPVGVAGLGIGQVQEGLQPLRRHLGLEQEPGEHRPSTEGEGDDTEQRQGGEGGGRVQGPAFNEAVAGEGGHGDHQGGAGEAHEDHGVEELVLELGAELPLADTVNAGLHGLLPGIQLDDLHSLQQLSLHLQPLILHLHHHLHRRLGGHLEACDQVGHENHGAHPGQEGPPNVNGHHHQAHHEL